MPTRTRLKTTETNGNTESNQFPEHTESDVKDALTQIELLDHQLERRFKTVLRVRRQLTRPLVSFQANKTRPVYRWYKYKEAFSASLVEYLFEQYRITSGRILDPFAGSGTALFVASELGMNADGIELLPIGQEIIRTRKLLEGEFKSQDFADLVKWGKSRVWDSENGGSLRELRITRGAYTDDTKQEIEKYLTAIEHESPRVRSVLLFVLLCVLESVSFTRKDGQYLRWDFRSGRQWGKVRFDKGKILDFDKAIHVKINEILTDLRGESLQRDLFRHSTLRGEINLLSGSCLEILPTLKPQTYDAVITSPPYANRYDYTRTYALELALLGASEQSLAKLRQEMLSCTVENRAKDLLEMNPKWEAAIEIANEQQPLQTILKYLDDLKTAHRLNNSGIPRMVRGYFYELACVIRECARILKPGGIMLMVNDNVRYAGASISVDMILSDFAEQLGFAVEDILVLPNGKGNSSQQMGEHGRKPLRKCVYAWRKN